MKENFENKFEDSYQKRERLLRELEEAFKDLEMSLNVFEKDITLFNRLNNDTEGLNNDIKEMLVLVASLTEERKKINQKFEDVSNKPDSDEKDEEMNKIIDESFENYNRIQEVQEKIDEAYELLDESFEDTIGAGGDFDGTNAIVTSKMKKLEDIARQIKELDNEGLSI